MYIFFLSNLVITVPKFVFCFDFDKEANDGFNKPVDKCIFRRVKQWVKITQIIRWVY